MANNQVNEITAIGICFCAVTAPITGGLSLFGIPAFLGARAIRANLDAKKKQERKENSSMRSLVPFGNSNNYPPTNFSSFPLIKTNDDQILSAILATKEPLELINLRKRKNDEDFLLGIAQSVAPAVEAMVLRHPNPRRLRVRGSVGKNIWGGTRFNFDIDVD